MAKYKVRLKATAVVIQEQIVDAENVTQAENLAMTDYSQHPWSPRELYNRPETIGVEKVEEDLATLSSLSVDGTSKKY